MTAIATDTSYRIAIEDEHFVIVMPHDLYCVMWDGVFARALVALPYVEGTHLVPDKPTALGEPVRLVVSTREPLRLEQVEQMVDTVRRAYETNGA